MTDMAGTFGAILLLVVNVVKLLLIDQADKL